jgi:hypothetical protein
LLELQLLSQPGVGCGSVAERICALARQLVGCEAAALFWLDSDGMPQGFHHEDSPPETRDLFANEFERLFLGAAEINVFQLAQMRIRSMGNLFAPPPAYFRSNTFNLLVRASGHEHCIDLRVDCSDGGKAVLLLFRPPGLPFREADLAALAVLEAPLRQIGTRTSENRPLRLIDSGHLVTDSRGEHVIAMCDRARHILRFSNLVGQSLTTGGMIDAAPRFVAELCARLDREPQPVQRHGISGGILRVRAKPMGAPQGMSKPLVLVTLEHAIPEAVQTVDAVLSCGLSPLRSRILLHAATGGGRDSVAQTLGISKEAARKHIAEIYRTIGASRWAEIPDRLGSRQVDATGGRA